MSHQCKVCNKYYSSYKSMWNHNKKFHLSDVNTNVNSVNMDVNANVNMDVNPDSNSYISSLPDCQQQQHRQNRNYMEEYKESGNILNSVEDKTQYDGLSRTQQNKCFYCNKIFTTRQAKSLHMKKYCKEKSNQETIKQKELELEIAKENNIRLKEEAKILKLKLKLQQSDKVDNITLKKLNKILLERHNRIKNSTINSHNNTTNIQNNITNNYQLIGFGKEENLNNILTTQEKRMILNSRFCSLEKIIEIVHCGQYNQFKNVIVTNMKDNYMYKYDDKKGVFVLSNKKDVLNMLVNYRLGDLEIIYNEFLENNKIDERTKSCIEKFINQINYDNEKFKNTDGTSYENYKQFKINEIKVLLFNNSEKTINDVSLFLSTEETEAPTP